MLHIFYINLVKVEEVYQHDSYRDSFFFGRSGMIGAGVHVTASLLSAD
jgi:hypothetical protein